MISLLTPLLASSAVFIQAQLKYGAERSDYLHRWYERPLHQNTAYQDFTDGKILNPAAWEKTVETLRFGKVDGLGVFTDRLRDEDEWGLLERSLAPGFETKLLMFLSVNSSAEIKKSLEIVERSLKYPNWCTLDGKRVLMLHPPFKSSHERAIAAAIEFRKHLLERYGDKFILMGHCPIFGKNDLREDEPSPLAYRCAKETLRNYLRAMDGIMYKSSVGCIERRYVADIFESTVGKVISEVFNEDEFKGKKYFCLHFNGGHMNSYRWQYNNDANGTATLCDRYESALKLSPDLILHGEWDEENENTHFRPTVSRGNTYMRIVRHFADRLAGRELTPAPGDDVSVPNLILSYRKALVAGEPVEVEVRNLPDGTFKGEKLKVSFEWQDMNGRTLRSYPAKTLDPEVQSAVRFVDKASSFLEHRVLVPRFRVEWSKGMREYSKGLYPAGIRALRNVDHVWVCHPLRDMPSDISGSMEIGECDADGVYVVKGDIVSSRPLRSIEVLDDMDTVYMHSDVPEVPSGHEQIRVRIGGFYSGKRAEEKKWISLKGNIRFRNVSGAVLKPAVAGRRRVGVDGDAWTFDGEYLNTFGITLWAHVPVDQMKDGAVDIDLPPHFKGTVRLADLVKKEVVGFNSVDSCGLSVMRYLPPASIPRPLMSKKASFSFRWKPLEKASVLRLQAIDEDYRVWRGAARTVYRPTGSSVVFSVFDRDSGKTETVKADAGLVEDVMCDIDDRTDSALRLGTGRMLSGMVGASVSFAQGFGRGPGHNGNPFRENIGYYSALPPGKRMPKTGWGCLSHQCVPGFAGFELQMRVKPAGFGEVQGLYGSGNCGLDVVIEKDGSVNATFARGRSFLREKGGINVVVRGPTLKDGEWNDVRVATDRHTAWVEVNGVRGNAVPYSDYFFNQRIGLFGATLGKANFFKGEISFLSVKPLAGMK